MKFNWGTGIFIFFGGFVIFMLSLVYFASLQNNELVTDNYYEKELAFKETLKKQKRTDQFSEQLSCKIEKNKLLIKFPKELNNTISGKLFFFKPSNKKDDKTINFEISNNEHSIDITSFSSGMYKLKIDWQSNDITYYNEQVIIIP